MISPSVLTSLITKGFPMAGASPTYDELCNAVQGWEYYTSYDKNIPTYHSSIVKVQTSKTVTYALVDTDWDNMMARLWLSVN